MVRLTKIYTRGGDAGQTSLGDGSRKPKHDPRIDAYGTVDEANAAIGLARAFMSEDTPETALLARIQNDLFDLGADLCVPEQEEYRHPPLRMTPAQVAWLEERIDEINADLAPLNSFILPGGTAPAAHLHMARTIIRRAERLIAALMEIEKVNPVALQYANRLSDFLFVLSRRLNGNGEGDILWIPGQGR